MKWTIDKGGEIKRERARKVPFDRGWAVEVTVDPSKP